MQGRNGRTFRTQVRRTVPLSTFLFGDLVPRISLDAPSKHTHLDALTLPLVSRIPNRALQVCLHRRLNGGLNVLSSDRLRQLVPGTTRDNISHPIPRLGHAAVHVLVKLLIRGPRLTALIPPLRGLSRGGLPKLNLFERLIGAYLSRPNLAAKRLLRRCHNAGGTTALRGLSV